MNIYVVCPVRKLERLAKISAYWRNVKEKIENDVADLEKQGYKVRYPIRDTDQNDEVGLRITEEHEQDIIWADEVYVWWYPEISEGGFWDIAQTFTAQIFMPEKKIVWAYGEEQYFSEYIENYLNEAISLNPVVIWWEPEWRYSLWKMAQARMAKHFRPEMKIFLSNFDRIKVTSDKSYSNVAIATHLGLTADTAKTRQDLLNALKKHGLR